VGEYAARLRDRLRAFARVQLVGELVNLRPARARVYFELRDAGGAVPCAAWRDDWERMAARCGELSDGMQVVAAGGCDYYPGSATSSPGFSFHVTDVRVAGAGDLLARIDRLRKALNAEGLLAHQKRLERPLLPRTIGVVTGEGGKARDDVLAGLQRRGWAGRLVWGFAPVQDRHAAPAVTRAVQDLAAAGCEVIVVARGGGSLADLLCFCDETLCRTVALLAVPVVASVGHHTDRTLLDDVAAVSCSTPTHAAEAAVPLHCGQAREELARRAERVAAHARQAVLLRARLLARQARAPAEHVARQRRRLDQSLRELRASARRRVAGERALGARRLLVLGRKAEVAALARERASGALVAAAADLRRAAAIERRRRELEPLAMALAAHDPERTLERGYALVRDRDGDLVTRAGEARRAAQVRISFADAAVDATIEGGT
jgi:exodeoxyribonuclease VII large subunit